MTAKRSKFIVAIVLLLLATVVGTQVYAVVLGRAIEDSRPFRSLGNHARALAELASEPSKADRFTFAVLGDTKSHGTFEALLNKIMATEPDFMILLGDFVMRPRLIEHRYFQKEIREVIPDSLPVFLLPGNHDVSRDDFTMADFNREYGDPSRTFTYANIYFVFCSILPKVNEEGGAERLEKLLQARPSRAERTFVFMHIPPRLNDQYRVRTLKESEPIQRVLEKYKVDTVFAGDYHGLYRARFRGVNYLITGGGGAHLKYPKQAGGFHHAVLVTVTPEWIGERILAVKRNEQFGDRFEYFAGVRLYSLLRDYAVPAVLANLVLLGLAGVVLRRWVRRRAA